MVACIRSAIGAPPPPPPPPPPYTGAPPATFNCVEVGGNASSGPLFTKLANTAFAVDIVALQSNRSVQTNYVTGGAKPITVELIDTSNPNVCAAFPSLSNQYVSFYSTTGRQTLGGIAVAGAFRSVGCRIRDNNQTPAVIGCSSDSFAVRPRQFALANAIPLNPANNRLAAGANFALTADPGVTAGYTGTPILNAALVTDHINALIAAGTLAGAFAAATGGIAAGNFRYSDVGTITFNANAVTDAAFTAIDQQTGVVGLVDHGPAGDCVAGSTANITPSGQFGCVSGSAALGPLGRFFPDHYEVTAELTAACNGFTYMSDTALGITLNVQAMSSTIGAPPLSRYTTGYGRLTALTVSGDNNGTAFAPLNNRLTPDLPIFTWTNGRYTGTNTYSFDRQAAPDGPYDNFRLRVGITDSDGALITRLNGVAIAGAATVFSAPTMIRFGILKLSNAYGSELLDLPMSIEAQYWNNNAFATNSLDRCTSVQASDIGMGNYQKNLSPPCRTAPAANLQLQNGRATLRLRRPGAGNNGAVDLSVNLGAVPAGQTCVAAPGAPTTATTANRPFLQGRGAGGAYNANPTARAAFGFYKGGPIIYVRELY